MAKSRRQRHRAWISLGLLLGLLFGGIPVADGCPLRAVAASGCHAEPEPAPRPAGERCCHPAEPVPGMPPRAALPAHGHSGPAPTCRTRTAPCCCVAGATQAVAERSARSGSSRGEARIVADAAPVAPPSPDGRALRIAAGPSRPAPSKVPLYLRTARLRN